MTNQLHLSKSFRAVDAANGNNSLFNGPLPRLLYIPLALLHRKSYRRASPYRPDCLQKFVAMVGHNQRL